MDFASIGFLEVLVILVIAMLVVGPRRLPEIARKLGGMAHKFRMATSELTRSITVEVEQETHELKGEIQKDSQEIKDEIENIAREVNRKGDETET